MANAENYSLKMEPIPFQDAVAALLMQVDW